jgi:hypothetical protein
VLDPIPVPLQIGGSNTLTGSGFTPGSVVLLYVATSSSAQSVGPLAPSAQSAGQLTFTIPVNTNPGNGYASVLVVNTDQGYTVSNSQSQLLFAAAASGLPTITSLNGVALSPADPSVPVANVSTVVVQGATLTVGGTDFSNPVVALFSSNPSSAALEPLPGGTSTQFQVVVPSDIPTGPGAVLVLNRPSFQASNAVSVPIGEQIRLDSVVQQGSTIVVNGAGFSTLTVINFFNLQGGVAVNLGGLTSGGVARISLDVISSHQLTFQIPAGAVSGPSYVQALNPPFIPFTSTGSSPNGAISITVP